MFDRLSLEIFLIIFSVDYFIHSLLRFRFLIFISKRLVYFKASTQRASKSKNRDMLSPSYPNVSCRKCKKYLISSSSITTLHSSSLPKAFPSPPLSFPPPRGGHDNAKRACNNFFEAVAVSRGGVSDSYPAFFLLIATTSNKNF